MNSPKQHIEFFQDQFRKPVIKLPLHQILIIWLGIALFWSLLSALDYYSSRQTQQTLVETTEETAPLKRQAAELQAKLDSLSKNKALENTEKQLRESLTSKRKFLSSLQFEGDSHSTNFSGYLRALAAINTESLWLTGIKISLPGPSLSLTGQAGNAEAIPYYMDRFKQSKQFAGMGFRIFHVERRSQDTGYLTFTVSTQHE